MDGETRKIQISNSQEPHPKRAARWAGGQLNAAVMASNSLWKHVKH